MGTTQFQKRSVHVLRDLGLVVGLSVWSGIGCSSLPAPEYKSYTFPEKEAFLEKPRPRPGYRYEILGQVRAKVNWTSLDPDRDEAQLCRNYYNRAVRDLVAQSKKNGGEAVSNVRSVVFLMNGKTELHTTPECSDDGEMGQVLLQGVAFRWRKFEVTMEKTPAPNAVQPSIDNN